jgi:hypothetical protein
MGKVRKRRLAVGWSDLVMALILTAVLLGLPLLFLLFP